MLACSAENGRVLGATWPGPAGPMPRTKRSFAAEWGPAVRGRPAVAQQPWSSQLSIWEAGCGAASERCLRAASLCPPHHSQPTSYAVRCPGGEEGVGSRATRNRPQRRTDGAAPAGLVAPGHPAALRSSTFEDPVFWRCTCTVGLGANERWPEHFSADPATRPLCALGLGLVPNGPRKGPFPSPLGGCGVLLQHGLGGHRDLFRAITALCIRLC